MIVAKQKVRHGIAEGHVFLSIFLLFRCFFFRLPPVWSLRNRRKGFRLRNKVLICCACRFSFNFYYFSVRQSLNLAIFSIGAVGTGWSSQFFSWERERDQIKYANSFNPWNLDFWCCVWVIFLAESTIIRSWNCYGRVVELNMINCNEI